MDTKVEEKPIFVHRRKRRMHPKDIVVLQMIREHRSIQEIVDAIHVKSTNSVHRRLKVLENAGLINPPPVPKMARSRTLTAEGERMLATYGSKTEVISGGTGAA